MAITRVQLPTLDELRDRYTRDIYRLKAAQGIARPNVAPGSEAYIRGEAVASAVLEVLARQGALQDATMPDAAEDEDLDRLADTWRGITRSPGAGAVGFVVARCTGSITYGNGQECTAKDGTRFAVTETTTTTDGGLIPIRGVDVGKKTNLSEGVELTWTAPPAGSDTLTSVGPGGLSGGHDKEDDGAFRARFLELLRYPAASGTWNDFATWAEDSHGAIEKAFVYPALRGPGTVHVAVAGKATSTGAYSRELNSVYVNLAARAITQKAPAYVDVTTQSVDNYASTNFVMKLTLPGHRADGGPGGGWLDGTSARWPTRNSAATTLGTDPLTSTVLRVSTSEEPVDDARIAVWSNQTKRFHHGRVLSHAVVATSSYNITLYEAIDTDELASGDYVSPDAEAIDKYGETLAMTFATLGPGEKTTSATYLPRSYRRPLSQLAWPSSYTSRDVGTLSASHGEIRHVAVVTPSLPVSTPAVSTTASAPYILTIGKVGFYPA